jgi:spermidine/putrescine transport system substrate-binding protein
MHNLDRRKILKAGAGSALLGSLATGLRWRAALAADVVPIRLWLQSQWWTDEYAAACEKAIGVRIQNTTTANNPTTFSKLMAGGGRDVDVVQIAGPFIPPMADQGVLQPIDMSKIPNAKALYPDFAKPEYAFGKDGKQYGVPFVWGYDSLLYNADKVAQSDSFGVLFDEKYKGHIGLRDDAFFGLSTAALYLGKDKPFALEAKDLQDVKKFLISKKPIIRTFWSSFADVTTLMKNGDIWATAGWLPIYWVLKQTEKMNVRYPVPKEGAPGWVACMVIPKETKSVEAAHRYINWMLSADWAMPIARDKGYYSTGSLGVPSLPAEIKQALNYDELDALMKRLKWSGFPPNLQDWTEAWTEFKAA